MRVIAAEQMLDLARERLHLAIRCAPPGSSVPGADALFNVEMFPVCSPMLLRDRTRPLTSPPDLVRHVLLDLEIVTASGPWSDWGPWLEAMSLVGLKPAGTLRFSHYDQVIQAAIDGSGVAIGRKPHNARHLRDGVLVAPFGQEAVLERGTYFTLTAPQSAERAVVAAFVAWLRDELREDVSAYSQSGVPHRRPSSAKSRSARAMSSSS